MTQRFWPALLFLLAAGDALGDVFKWVDENGRVQFGDHPPPGADARAVEMHKVPTPDEVGRAKQRFDDRLEQARRRVLGPREPAAGAPTTPSADTGTRSPQDAPCFAAMSDFIHSPAGAAFVPITPSVLTAEQREELQDLFRKAEGHWQGRVADLACLGNPPAGEQRTVMLEIDDAHATWNPVDSQLVVDSQVAGDEQESLRLFIKFRVTDALYFNTAEMTDQIDLVGNKVELLSMDGVRVSFILKNRAPGAGTSRPLRTELRYWDMSGPNVIFTELYFRNELLSGSRTWSLTK